VGGSSIRCCSWARPHLQVAVQEEIDRSSCTFRCTTSWKKKVSISGLLPFQGSVSPKPMGHVTRGQPASLRSPPIGSHPTRRTQSTLPSSLPLPSAFARLESKAFSFLSAQVHRTPGLHPHFSPSLSVNLEKTKRGRRRKASSSSIHPPHGDGIHHPHLPPCRKQETTARSQRITRGSSRARRSEYSSSSINPRGVRP
jgi:hypothetical protein